MDNFFFLMAKQYTLFIFNYEFLQQLQDPTFGKIKSRFVNKKGEELERLKNILKGNYAIIGKVIGNVFFPNHHLSSADSKVRKFSILPVPTSGLNADQ